MVQLDLLRQNIYWKSYKTALEYLAYAVVTRRGDE